MYLKKGIVADFRLGYGKVLSRKSKIISINRSKSQLTKVNQWIIIKNRLIKNFNILFKNSDIYWKPTLAVESDPASFMVKLADSLKGFKGSDEWISTLRSKDDAKEEINQ